MNIDIINNININIHITIHKIIGIRIYMNMNIIIKIIINSIASRIPAARPEGSLFVVPGFLSLCVRKLNWKKTTSVSAFSQIV